MFAVGGSNDIREIVEGESVKLVVLEDDADFDFALAEIDAEDLGHGGALETWMLNPPLMMS